MIIINTYDLIYLAPALWLAQVIINGVIFLRWRG
jgi:hypothetical protein